MEDVVGSRLEASDESMGLYRRKDSNNWWVALTVDGKKVNVSTRTTNKRQAVRILDKLRGQVIEGKFQLTRTVGVPSFQDWSQTFLQSIVHPNTRRRYTSSVNNLVSHLGAIKLVTVTPEKIDGFINARLQAGVGPATINRDLATLRRLLRLAIRKRYLTHSPFDQVELLNERSVRRQPHIVSPDEEMRIMAAIPPDHYMRALLVLLVETGLRVYKEALHLKWIDVDIENKCVYVRESKTAAGIRSIPLSPHCIATLALWREQTAKTYLYVFPNVRRGDVPLQQIQRGWQAILLRAKVPYFRIYDFRATFASRLSACGLSELQIAQLLGHSSGRITTVYAKLVDQTKQEAISRLSQFRSVHFAPITASKEFRWTN